MSYFTLSNNGVNNPIRKYGDLENLRRIMQRNDDSFNDYIKLGNRTLPNQHPLVHFLLSFSVNLEWTPEYLINVIDNKLQQYASLADLTSLYNKGKDHVCSIYPEVNHHTLLVVPFNKPSASQINGYFSGNLDDLVPLYPIYTTDVIQRYDIMQLINTQTYRSPKELYSIVQVDPYALIIGFYRMLKSGREWGQSPHGYLAGFPLMNCYLYHNELVNYNYLNNYEGKIQTAEGSWNYEPFETKLAGYTDFKNRYLLSESMKSFTHFFNVNIPTNPKVDSGKMVFPETGKSLYFMQMSWVWTIASLGMVEKYLDYNRFVGTVDGLIMSQLRTYFNKYPVQTQLNQIKSNVWQSHSNELWQRVKNKV